VTSLDVIRGVAVLGMLAVNVQSFAAVSVFRANPTAAGPLDALDWAAWLIVHTLADGKFMAVFAVLFGAGVSLLGERLDRTGRPTARVHYRRMAILLGVGLLHAYGLWYGDILAPLAVCGALVFLYRDLPPPRLLGIGLALFAFGSALAWAIAWWRLSQPDLLAAALEHWTPTRESIAWEISRYRGGWLDQLEHRVLHAFAVETGRFATRELWRLTGLMLVGMALCRLGAFGGGRWSRLHGPAAAAAFGLGVPVVLLGVQHNVARDWDLRAFRLVGEPLSYWGGALVAMGWIALLLWLLGRGWRLHRLAAVGRLALTSYLMQTLICTSIFYGHGLGLFGALDLPRQLGVVAAIWAVQLAAADWWLRRFALGPMEWGWRCLTYGRRLPLRLRSY
jgi:uncharacterized protein